MARLEAASVIGPTFAARIAAAGCGEDAAEAGSAYARLARDTQLLRRIGEATWPDGSASARFQFAHEVFQGTVYDRIPPARRQLLHQRIGEAVERCHAGETELVATELAHHFQRAGDLRRSVLYLRMAQTAEQRGALREASQAQLAALQELARMPVTRPNAIARSSAWFSASRFCWGATGGFTIAPSAWRTSERGRWRRG